MHVEHVIMLSENRYLMHELGNVNMFIHIYQQILSDLIVIMYIFSLFTLQGTSSARYARSPSQFRQMGAPIGGQMSNSTPYL